MQFLNIESGRIFPDKDHSELSHPSWLALEEARLNSDSKLDTVLPNTIRKGLLELLQELQLEQELR